MLLQHGQLLLRQVARGLYATQLRRQFNHYESLGIAKSSTQSEIKSAYYKLSMLYHPDRNPGSEEAVKKFRQINQAYEVLGNYRLRRLYDKGIVHTAGSQYAEDINDVAEHVEEDDPSTKFYKSRFKKSKVADAEGRTPIYDFDEWSREHYGKSFDRRKAARDKYERIRKQKESSIASTQTDIVMFAFIFAGLAVYLMFVAESAYDTPKQRAESRHSENLKRTEQQQPEASNGGTN